MKKVAVVGAGWAGLAAAVRLVQQGFAVCLFEAGRVAGGRGRAVRQDSEFSFLDNGQHLMLGAYRRVWDLMDTVGADRQGKLSRRPFYWHIHNGMRWHSRRLPAPLHLLAGLVSARGIAWADKAALLRQTWALKQGQRRGIGADLTLSGWLAQQNVSEKLIRQFWQPLCEGALNTPPQSASLKVLADVLVDSVWGGRHDADWCVPQCDLTALLAEPALAWLQKHGAEYMPQCRVPRLRLLPENGVEATGRRFDAAVIAVAPYHAAALLPETAAAAPLKNWLDTLTYHAITTVYLRYPPPVSLPVPVCGLSDGTAQWLLARPDPQEVAAVISVSEQHGSLNAEQWVQRVHHDILRVCPHLPAPVAQRVLTEKRATAAASSRTLPNLDGLQRGRIFMAGDYLHPRYPATLEAAVQSGETAARQLAAAFRLPENR